MPPRRRPVDPILAFRQHGFREIRKSADGSHAIGDCPICGKQDHFYVNIESKMWDCKSGTHGGGGFQTFLQEMLRVSRENPELDTRLQELSKNRGLTVDTLQRYSVGYNPLTSEYLIPVFYQDGGETKVWNLRRVVTKRSKKGETKFEIFGTAGCQVGILGWEQAPAYQRLWLCEGGWDAMACDEILRQLGIDSDLPLGLPGAGTLKPQWIPLLQKHDIIAVYDADEAGRNGALRAYNLLHNRVGLMQFVHWGDVPDGYDLRDLYKAEGTATFDALLTRLRQTPEGVQVADAVVTDSHRHQGPGLPAEEVYKAFNKWLYMEDMTLIDVVLGTVIGNRGEGEPIWLHIVAPPGATKTEVLRALDGAPDIIYRNVISSKNLVSGQITAGGSDPSLLPRLHERMLVIEDWTTLMSSEATDRGITYGILRAAYNGKFEREWGNTRYVNFLCHFGMITGVTPALEQHMEEMGAVGERFLNCIPYIPDDDAGRMPFLEKAQANDGHESEMRKELSETMQRCLTYPFDAVPKIPDDMKREIRELALWSARMRGTVPREKYGVQRDITQKAYWELGTRLVKQYGRLIDGIGRFKRLPVVGIPELNTIKDVAAATIRSDRITITRALWKRPADAWTTTEIAEATRLPRSPLCERTVEELMILQVLRREQGVKGLRSSYKYRFTDSFIKLTNNSGVFTNN